MMYLIIPGMVFPDFSITKDMKTLAIFCINRKYGCTETFPWSKAAAHLRQCEYVLVLCVYTDRECTQQLPRVHMKTHEEVSNFEPQKLGFENEINFVELYMKASKIYLRFAVIYNFCLNVKEGDEIFSYKSCINFVFQFMKSKFSRKFSNISIK